MKTLRASLFICLFLIMSIDSLSAVEIFGYYEPQFMGVSINDDYSQLFTNKLRVDLQSSEGSDITFGANFDYIHYSGKTDWNILDYLPDYIVASAPSGSDSLLIFTYNDTVFLDNAYCKFALSIFDITLGKQQISVGTGYAWNPTDLFNTKDVIDPTYEQPGHSAIRVDAALSLKYNATLIYLPEDTWNESAKLLTFKGKFSHFDYSLIYVEKQWQLSDFLGYNGISSKRQMYGGDIVGELLGLGVWSEFGYNTLKGHDDFWEILAGGDYTFDNGLYVMAEYYRNDLGKADCDEYDLNDWLRFYFAESRTISRDNLYLYFDYPLNDLIHLSNSFITAISDQSVSVVPSLSYNIFENAEMNMFLNFNLGSDKKAYSSEQGYSGILRFKIYF